jgi:hypothetical protein
MALTVFWDIRGSKWGQHPEFWILFSVWFWWRFYYEISCPCFSNRFDQALMVVDINDIKGDQNGQTPNFIFKIKMKSFRYWTLSNPSYLWNKKRYNKYITNTTDRNFSRECNGKAWFSVIRGHLGHDRLVVGFANTCAVSASHH